MGHRQKLLDAILNELSEAKWGLSIQALTKALNEKHGMSIHRLELGGFVKALELLGVLDIVEFSHLKVVTLDGKPISEAKKAIKKVREVQRGLRGKK